MKKLAFTGILVISFIAATAQSSEYDYSYDANGNRIQRSHTTLMVAPPNGDEVQETLKNVFVRHGDSDAVSRFLLC